jgi:hypothetical protein
MFMCVVNLKAVNKLDLTWKQSFLIKFYRTGPWVTTPFQTVLACVLYFWRKF